MTDNETTSSIRGERDLANAQDIIVCEGAKGSRGMDAYDWQGPQPREG